MDEDNKDEGNSLHGAIQDYLERAQTPRTIQSVLGEISDKIDVDKVLDSPQSPASRFAEEVIRQDAEIAAVVVVDTNDKYKDYMENAGNAAIDTMVDNLKNKFKVDIQIDETDFDSPLHLGDILYKDQIIRKAIDIISDPEGLGRRPDTEIFNRSRDQIGKLPADVRIALKDYCDWLKNRGKYTGGTGRTLDAALISGLIPKNAYDRIVKARDSGRWIIHNEGDINTNGTFRYWNQMDKQFVHRRVIIDAWAIAPPKEQSV